LKRALADGDRVFGVLRGLGLSSDGRGKSLWAPRREGQVLAIRRAFACGVNVGQRGYVEAHGTSTPVGDTTEVAALQEGLGRHLSRYARRPQKLAGLSLQISSDSLTSASNCTEAGDD
jgi:acyl transferase domain-containing protein